MAATYFLNYNLSGDITPIEFSSISFGRKENSDGVLNVSVLPYYQPGFFVKDARLDLYRSVDGQPGDLVGNTVWFINQIRYARTLDEGDIIELSAVDLIGWIKRRLVAYEGDTTYTAKIDFADNVMKAVMRENFGVSAIDVDRNMSSYLAVQADTSQGALLSTEMSFKNVLDVIQDAADSSWQYGIRIIFDIIPTGNNTFEFRTYKDYQGVDHSISSNSPIVVSVESGSLLNAEIIADYSDECNYVYARGANVNGITPTAEVKDATRIPYPWSRREGLMDASNTSDSSVLETQANQYLKHSRPKIQFSGTVKDTPSIAYGVNYNYGDLITAQFLGYSIDCRVDSISGTFSQDQGEQIEINLRGEFYG